MAPLLQSDFVVKGNVWAFFRVLELLPVTTSNTRCELSACGLLDSLSLWLTSRLVPAHATNHLVTTFLFPQHMCVCNHCIVIIPIVAMVAKHTMKKQIMLHLLDWAEIGGIWDKDLFHPSSKNFS